MLFGQSGNDKLIVGYDLEEEFVQISYLYGDAMEPETLSMVAGEERYNIPAVLCKREGVNQWYFGKEALRYSEETGVPLVEHLGVLVRAGEPVEVEGNEYDPIALLALFFKRSMGLLFSAVGTDQIEGLMLTSHHLDEKEMKIVNKMLELSKVKASTVICQSHVESFYGYLLGQQPELLEQRTVLYERQGDSLVSIVMECNRATTPKVVYADVQEKNFPFFRDGLPEEIDRELAYRMEDTIRKVNPHAVYLIGEEFREEKIPATLEMLCRTCRVFQGNNLYSKGACLSMQENCFLPSETGKKFVYLGREMLKANVGMNLLKQGENSYIALLDAGTNWFEAQKTVELYVNEQSSLDFEVVSLVGKDSVTKTVSIEGIAPGISRIRLQLYMEQADEITVLVSDLGFGEIRAATETVWKTSFEV